jgi:hypothetical protein
MKKVLFISLALFVFSLVSLAAHPAGQVSATFNQDENLLIVSFQHQVRDNVDHFIADVAVRKNNKVILTQKLGTQDSKEGGTLVYKINDLKPGDKLVVTTRCNKMGNKSATLEIK